MGLWIFLLILNATASVVSLATWKPGPRRYSANRAIFAWEGCDMSAHPAALALTPAKQTHNAAVSDCKKGCYTVSSYADACMEFSGECVKGFFCPWASTSPMEEECGSAAVFCPPRSGSPTPVSLGYYSNLDTDVKLRHSQFICEPGRWCHEGVRNVCPAGKVHCFYSPVGVFTFA